MFSDLTGMKYNFTAMSTASYEIAHELLDYKKLAVRLYR